MRKFLTLLSAILLSAVMYADGSLRLYCQMTYEWWTSDGAAIAMYAYGDGNVTNGAWPGVRMMAVDGQTGVWYADVDSALYANVIFVRVNGSDELADWGAKTADLTIPRDGNYLYTITSSEAVWSDGNDGTVSGVWRNYADVNTPLDGSGNGGSSQTTYYLIGNFTNSWSMDDALAMDGDSIVTNLQAGEYKFKVVRGLTWDNALGYNNLDYGCSSYNIRSDDDGNVCVTLASEGTLSVRVDNGQLCVNGTFANTDNQAYFIALVSPEGAGYTSPAGANYTIGSTFEVTASISTGGWMFDRWSDNDSWDNPRTITLTQDTTITAIFSPGEYGLQINGTRTVPGTYTGRVAEGSYVAQFLVTTYLNEGDQIKVINLFHNDNSTWRPEIENGGMSGNFVNSGDNLTCYTAGCYDIYIKIAYGQSEDYVYIAEGSNCDDQQGGNTGGNTDEEVLYSTTFFDWESMTVSTERTMSYSGYPFTFNNVKITPDQKPTSVSDASAGYIKPTSISSCYVQVGALTSVTRVTYKQAASVAGAGWRLESSSNGVDWYAFNDNEEGVATANQVEQREIYVYMENVWLRWVPLPSNSNTNVYLTEFAIYGIVSSSGPEIVASGECAANGSAEVTWLLSSDSILTIGGSGRMADYDEDSNIAPWYQYKDAYNSVYIAAGVTNVGDLAFRQSTNLRYVDLASTVTELGSYSFYSCPALHTFTLPDNVTTLGENSPFGGTTTMTSPVYNSHVFVCLNSDFTGEYTVSSGTTTVASHAFRGCSMLTSVVLPSTVTSLPGSSTFENCSALASVNIPEGVTSLGMYAFSGCTSLMGIDLPSTMSSLGSYCLAECSAIDSIVCRATTPPTANGSTFSGVREGTTIYVPGQSIETYLAADGWSTFGMYQALDESAGNMCPVSGTCGVDGNNVLWTLSCDSVLTISGTGAMADYMGSSYVPWSNYSNVIREAVVGSGVTSLSNYSTFEECTALESVIIPEGITSLGDYTFNNCTSLKGIDLPSTITSLGSYCFSGCSGMDSIVSRAITPPTANGSTFGIGDDAIRVYVPVSAIAAYQSADGWSSFTNFMALPEGCIIASGTCGADGYNIVWVLDCDSVMTISGTGEMASYTTNSNGQAPWASYGSQIRDIVIEEGITKASPYGFYNAGSYTNGAYNNVRSVTIPSTMNTLVNNNFYQCPIETVTINSDSIVGRTTYSSSSNLQNIFGAQVRQYIIGSSVHSIAASAFYNQSADSVRSIILPEGLTSIGDWGFGYLENMDSITLPSTLQSIGADAFYGSGLKAITIPAGVTTMGGQAFQNCDKLTSLTLEEGLTSIGTSAFANCTALPEVTIPESMQTISSGAFTGCTNLTKVTVLSSTWVGETKSSSSITKQAIGGYVRELILGDQITTLGKYAFSGLDSLRSVTLPANLEIIGNEAFSACKKLQSITLPSTVTTLGNYAFNGCTALDSIRLNEGLLRIGAQVFYQCTSLQRVTLPASLIGINGTSFYGCTGLTEMTLPDGALHPDSLGNNIFGGCTNLTKLTINSRTLCEGTYTTSQNLKTNFGQDALRTLIIGEGMTSIGNYAFYNASISTLVLPSTLTSVGNGSFGSCSSLTNVTSNALTPPTIQSGSFSKQDTLNVLCAAKEAYQDADYWKNFTTILADCAGGYCGGENNEENVIWSLSGEGVLTITGTGKMASYQSDTIVPWYGHRAEILSVIIGEGVESITPYAFLQCWNLASVTIPSTVNSIGGLAFGHCSSLESVTIPKGITYIEGYTFTGCTSLSSIEIPASVTQIANEAFSGCTSLGNIYCRGAYPPVDDLQNAFKNIDTSIVTVFVPSRSINLYKAADGWKKFSNIRGQDDPNRFTMPISTEWQFIMLPSVTGAQSCGLSVDSIVCDSTLTWARYLGSYRAQGKSGWVLFNPADNEGEFLCSSAYIVRANGPGATLTMKVAANAANMSSETHTYEKHQACHAENANWNFVGNPYPYYYNILAQLNAMGITTPITIWNGTGYEIFTPGIDTERMLAPFEAFFIQVPEDVESVVITFSGEYIIM